MSYIECKSFNAFLNFPIAYSSDFSYNLFVETCKIIVCDKPGSMVGYNNFIALFDTVLYCFPCHFLKINPYDRQRKHKIY